MGHPAVSTLFTLAVVDFPRLETWTRAVEGTADGLQESTAVGHLLVRAWSKSHADLRSPLGAAIGHVYVLVCAHLCVCRVSHI